MDEWELVDEIGKILTKLIENRLSGVESDLSEYLRAKNLVNELKSLMRR